MTNSYGEFSGEPKTIWLTENKTDRYMTLIEPFWFKGKGFNITVPAAYRIDGASIPRALWTLVGSPYTGDYRRASIVHDKACDDAVGDAKKRRAADRMFFYACMAGGCSWLQAAMLYVGVRIGAALDQVSYWKESADLSPRFTRSQADLAIEGDFSAAARFIERGSETDDAEEIERRADDVLSVLTGRNFRQP